MKLKNFLESRAFLWIALGVLALAGALAVIQPSSPQTMTGDEKRIAEVLSAIEDAGKVEVALFYAQPADGFSSQEAVTPTGAVVVAQGARDLTVRLNLIRAIRTLLSLPETAVDVFVMEEGR